MKKPRELIEFLFGDSQQASEREMLTRDFAHIFEEMERQEELEPKKTPLKSALSSLGVKGELEDDTEGFTLAFENGAEYRKAKTKLRDPETMEKLAELGWVVTDCGDVAMTGEDPEFKFRFVEITDDEPENSEKRPGRKDLEAIVKAAKEFSYSPKTEQPEPKTTKGGLGKAKPGGDAKHAIKDSLRQRQSVDQLVTKLLED